MTAATASPAAVGRLPDPSVPGSGRRRRESALFFVARHAIAIAIAICALAPVVFIVLTSFMSERQSLTSNYIPTSWHPGN
jgi:multiple sugar transport system permease protein